MNRAADGRAKWVGTVVAAMVLFVSLQSTAAPTTALGLLAGSMKPGTWAELETSGYSEALLQVQRSTILDYANTAVWDPSSEQVLFIGQGHYAALKFIAYSAQANSWKLMSTPPWWRGDPQTGQGPIGHAYGNNAIDPYGGVFYFHQSGTSLVHRYEIARAQWSTLPDLYAPIAHGTALAYFPEMKSLVRVLGGSLQVYREEKQSWSVVGHNLPMGAYHNIAVYNGPRHSVILGGGNASQDLYEVDARGRIVKLLDARSPIRVSSTLVTVDPVTGHLLVVNAHEKTFVGLDLERKEWEALPDPPIVEGAAAAISTYGVTLFLGIRPAKVYLYKHLSAPAASFLGSGECVATDGPSPCLPPGP